LLIKINGLIIPKLIDLGVEKVMRHYKLDNDEIGW
jgi:hypothetical protein